MAKGPTNSFFGDDCGLHHASPSRLVFDVCVSNDELVSPSLGPSRTSRSKKDAPHLGYAGKSTFLDLRFLMMVDGGGR